MLIFSQSKINIGLSILDQRPDGFHNIETIFYPIPWHDAIEVFPSDNFGLHCYGNDLKIAQEDHLIYKTWQYIKTNFESLKDKEVEVHHLKNIPHGAGLGGGSGNVAAFIKGVNQIFNCQWSIETMKGIATHMGSDCAFFIEAQPSVGKGRGEILDPIFLDLSDFTIQVFAPSIHVNTGHAFKALREKRKGKTLETPADYSLILRSPIARWKHLFRNDFIELYTDRYPQITGGIELLYEEGALFAGLSGTGPSFYGIFPKGTSCQHESLKDIPQITI